MIKFIEIETIRGIKQIFNLDCISRIVPKTNSDVYLIFLQEEDFGYEISLETYNLIHQYLLVNNFMD